MNEDEQNERMDTHLYLYVAAFQRENGPIGFRSLIVAADTEPAAYDAGWYRAVGKTGHASTFKNDYVQKIGRLDMIHPEPARRISDVFEDVNVEYPADLERIEEPS